MMGGLRLIKGHYDWPHIMFMLCLTTIVVGAAAGAADKCISPPPSVIANGYVTHMKGVLHFKCNRGFILRGQRRIKCSQMNDEAAVGGLPVCVLSADIYPLQMDQAYAEYESLPKAGSGEEQYGDYYDYDYDGDKDDAYEETYNEYNEETPLDHDDDDEQDHHPAKAIRLAGGDDEDYDIEEGSGSGDYANRETTTTIVTSSTTEASTTTTTMTTTPEAPTTTTSSRRTTTMPTDDEDLYDGSGSGDFEEVEGSGGNYEVLINQLTPEMIDTVRRAFYYEHQVDLLRVDNSCKHQFITAPQLFNAKIVGYDHEVPNEAMLGKHYSTVDYVCDEGYESDSLQLFCFEAEWHGRNPDCQKVLDEDLHEIEDGITFAPMPKQCSEAEAAKCQHLCVADNNDISSCICHSGFLLDPTDNANCIDVDECAEDNGGCDQSCINKPGTALCDCIRGYTLADDGRRCVDDNECTLNNGHGPCQDMCTNTDGGYECACHSVLGTVLGEDGHSCENTNGCSNNNGGCSDKCIDSYSQVFCLCPEGFSLASDWKTCRDVDECDEENGACSQLCVNTAGAHECQCHVGFRKHEVDGSCLDVDECDEIAALCSHGDCVNLPGTYLCECHPGFRLADGTCDDINECNDEANKAVCGNSGRCVNLVGTFECQCDLGYEMSSANKTCVDVNECRTDNPCVNGDCVNEEPNYSCICFPGYHEVNGVCVDSNECLTDTHPCGLGECINTEGAYECLCPKGYAFTEAICKDINECATNETDVCGLHGDCVNLEGGYECRCHGGFNTSTNDNILICVDIDECTKSSPCTNGTCLNLEGSFECECSSGFHLVDKYVCGDVDECSFDNGGCDQICSNTIGSHRCSCQDGYQPSPNYAAKCEDVNECLVDNGGCPQKCRNEKGSFKCACSHGYASLGANVNNCADVDECLKNNGGCQHFCNNSDGGYFCTCRKGYEVALYEPTFCADVDECAADNNGGCSDLCINMDGGHTCGCPSGHQLRPDGKTCQLSDKGQPCASHPRPRNGFLRCNAKKSKSRRKFPPNTKCRLKCKKGFRHNPDTGPVRTKCLWSGEWGGLGSCEPIQCKALPFLQNGSVEPPQCSITSQPVDTKCSFSCNQGYRLIGKKTTSCSKKLRTWKHEMPTCQSDFPKPFIMCPADITKALSGRTSSVYVMIPQPKTNVDWFRYVDAEPSWAKQLEGEMTRGRHVITFRARSPVASVSASCQMLIHVKDMEPPRVQQCPESFTEMLAPGQSVKRITWTEPVFSDNVKIQHVMASFLPGHYFSAGKHNILYQATDADGNRGKCGFTINVMANAARTKGGNRPTSPLGSAASNEVIAAPKRQSFKNYAVEQDSGDSRRVCDAVPSLENGRMVCKPYGNGGKRCTPVCNGGHQFYQKFVGQPPTYLCLPPKRVDWKIRKFIPDCSPIHGLVISGRQCEAGWEQRASGMTEKKIWEMPGQDTCVACPPGMYRSQDEPLCQLCHKGLYSDQFGSAKCVRCPMYHTTRGLGSRKSSQCYYHRPAARSSLLDRRKGRNRDSSQAASFMYYNRWMSRSKPNDEDDIT